MSNDTNHSLMNESLMASEPTQGNAENVEGIEELGIAQDDFARVSPVAIVYFFVKSLVFFVSNFLLYLIPALVLQLDKIKQNLFIASMAVLAIVAIFLVVALLKYLFYFYRLNDERVEVRSGVFQKSHIDLPYHKIQNVKIEQPFYFRPLGYSTLELETAGSATQEAKIVAVKLDMAEEFKHRVLNFAKTQESNDDPIEGEAQNQSSSSTEKVLNTRSVMDLVIHGITNNRVWILLGAAAPFYDAIATNIGDVLETIGFDIAAYLDYNSLSVGIFLLHALSVVMFIMLILVSLSVIGSIFVFFNYQLSRLGDRYYKRSGLLTKQEVSMKRSRIQVATQQQDWLDIVIDRANLKLEQNNAGVANPNQTQLNSANKLIVPSVKHFESDDIIQDVFNQPSVNSVEYTPISKRFLIRLAIFPVVPLIIAITAIAIAGEFTLQGWLYAAGLSGFISLMAFMRWKRWGYHISDEFVYIRKGMFGVDYHMFPKHKAQQVKFKQTIFMTKYQLANINIVLASGGQKLYYIPASLAMELIDECLLIVEKDKPAWM